MRIFWQKTPYPIHVKHKSLILQNFLFSRRKSHYLEINVILITKVSCSSLTPSATALPATRQDSSLAAFPLAETKGKQRYQKKQQADGRNGRPDQKPRVSGTTLLPASVQWEWTLQVCCIWTQLLEPSHFSLKMEAACSYKKLVNTCTTTQKTIINITAEIASNLSY